MKKFKFRLERVLQYRLIIKDERRRELQQKLLELREAEDRLDMLEKAWLGNQLESEQILQAEIVIMRGLYAARLKFEIAQQIERIQKLEEEADEARSNYIEASRDVEVLERFKQKKKEDYIHETDLVEGKFLDELAVQRSYTVRE